MKTKSTQHSRTGGQLRGLQLCGLDKTIAIAGQTFVPDAATAYIEFFMAHAFPLFIDVGEPGQRPYCSALHPRTLANSYLSLVGKPMNLAHLIKAYNPKKITKDHVFGTVMAVEFGRMVGDVWEPATGQEEYQVVGDTNYCIRAVAALHKNLEGVAVVIDTWNKGVTPFSETPWTVSMENESYVAQGGFLIHGLNSTVSKPDPLETFFETTPEDFKKLGWCYVPFNDAPDELVACLRDDDIIGLKADYCGCQTLFLNGGLNGKIFFYGVALVPQGRESAARVGRIYAGQELVDLTEVFNGINGLIDSVVR